MPSASEQLRSNGFAVIPGALPADAVERLTGALDRVCEEEGTTGGMHLLGGIWRDDAFVELVDHPATFSLVSAELGWNIHLFHCHLDVTPPGSRSPAWGWHQDGGRINLDLDGAPRPRVSLKVAFWLSDVSEPGRGNMLVIPGSHNRNTLRRHAPPAGATPVLANAGDALVFDRRLWHSRSDNLSGITRRAIFLAYTFRWILPRDDFGIDPSSRRFRRLQPVRRQLLGESAGPMCCWGLGDEPVPLRAELDRS